MSPGSTIPARRRASLEERAAQLDALVEYFGPGGAMIGQASSQIRNFNESLNWQLAHFGYKCDFEVAPYEIHVGLLRNSDSSLRLSQLSESERFRFGIAFQVAVAILTGLRLVVIDRAEMLDSKSRRLLTGLFLQGDLDQAIVLATGDEASPPSVPLGVRFIDL
jgi:hypothetical protein